MLFGDGAGAVLLVAGEGQGTSADRGILSTHLHSDGRFGDILLVDGGPGSTGGTGKLRMAGNQVFRHAVSKLAAVVDEALDANGLGACATCAGWCRTRRTSASSTPWAASSACRRSGSWSRWTATPTPPPPPSRSPWPRRPRDGRIERGDLVVMEAIGGGLAWGAALARF